MPAWLKQFGRPTEDLANNPSGYYLPLSDDTLLVSILLVGTFFGALLAAPVAGPFWSLDSRVASYFLNR